MPQANAFLNDYCLPQNRRTGHFTNRERTTIAVLAALHFAVSFAARMAGGVLYVFLGPWSTFVDGIGGEGIPCLLLAVTIVLVPRSRYGDVRDPHRVAFERHRLGHVQRDVGRAGFRQRRHA